MKALMFDRLGLPADVVDLRQRPEPVPGPGEALVQVLLSPIIPGDSLFTQGLYPEPVKPHFPGETAGNYGIGLIKATGPGVELAKGTLVTATHRRMWAQAAAVPVTKLVTLPENYRHDLGAEFMNLVTAWDLLELAHIARGQWLAITAGNSTVSMLLTQFASALGIRVLSIVRKKRSTTDLKALGAEAVLAIDETSNVQGAVRDITGGGVSALIDCVGGPHFGALARAMQPGSRAIIYGGFSQEPFSLHNLDILLNGLEIRSYIYRFFFNPPAPTDEARIRQLLAFSAYLNLHIPIAARYPLEQFAQAFADIESGDTAGRRYFAPNA